MKCSIPKPEEVNCVIVHKNCQDGFGSALAAWMLIGEENVEYHYMQYSDEPPDVKGKNVAIIDFTFPKEVILKMLEEANTFILLDHHKSAMNELGQVQNTVFDMSKSGARMAYEFFHPNKEVPRLIRLIEDRDIWSWTEPDSKEFHAAFPIVTQTFSDYYELIRSPILIDILIDQGKAIIKFNDMYIEKKAKDICMRTMNGLRTAVVNSTYLISELGNYLAKKEYIDMALIWFWDSKKNKYMCSLRSVGDIDVSIIAKSLGGGGHKHASGFICDNINNLFEST